MSDVVSVSDVSECVVCESGCMVSVSDVSECVVCESECVGHGACVCCVFTSVLSDVARRGAARSSVCTSPFVLAC